MGWLSGLVCPVRLAIIALLAIPAVVWAATGDPSNVAEAHLRGQKRKLGLTDADLNDHVMKDRYVTKSTGTTHIYLRQRHAGIEVFNADVGIHVTRDGRAVSLGNRFVPNLAGKIDRRVPVLTAPQAVARAAEHLQLKLIKSGPVKLMYFPQADRVRLTWNFTVRVDGQHCWNMFVDAKTGQVLAKFNQVVNDTYGVFAMPLESPDDGALTLETNTFSVATNASPFGWHGTDGLAGAEFTDTRGNNVFAQEDADANDTGGTRPDGGAGLDFDFALDLGQDPTNETYQSAAIVNLFYWNNVLHDLHYQYGFDEAAGNFQQNNYDRGGLSNDAVQADAQDGSDTNNANFFTPTDGEPGRMQMFIWTYTSPRRDSDFDNGVIIHEYGHGVSTRLTGGPSNSSCLQGIQSGGMGEGWSDWWALVLTAQTNRTHGLVTYLLGEPPTGVGIRHFRYSTDLSENPLTYGSIGITAGEVHYVGEIWCEALWEMYWNLVDASGFSTNLYTGAAGNNIALQLVMDGLKLQPCNPTFLNARDAILQADQIRYGGAHLDLLWRAFAKRGLGFSAYDGGSHTNFLDVIEAFDLPGLSVVGLRVTAGNGLVDPNECNQLAVMLRNNTPTTGTVVSATLSTSTPGVTVLQPLSTYADIDPGATATNITLFVIETSPSFSCGASIDFTLIATYDGGATTSTFSLATSGLVSNSTGAAIEPGTTDLGVYCDDCATNIALPFPYMFYDETYTNVTLSSNGYLQFNGDTNAFENLCLPRSGFGPTIFAYWDDLRTDGSGNGIFTSITGSAPDRIFNIEWRAVDYALTTNVNFEVRLYEGQARFDLIFDALNDAGASATVGAQKDTTRFTRVRCTGNPVGLTAGLQLTFLLPVCSNSTGQCDSDSDGMPDTWELSYILDPNDATDAAQDADGDGMTNLAEFLAGTDPRDATSGLRITDTGSSGDDWTVTFTTVTGKTYGVESCDDLVVGLWTTVTNNVAGVGGLIEIIDAGGATVERRFYRIKLMQ